MQPRTRGDQSSRNAAYEAPYLRLTGQPLIKEPPYGGGSSVSMTSRYQCAPPGPTGQAETLRKAQPFGSRGSAPCCAKQRLVNEALLVPGIGTGTDREEVLNKISTPHTRGSQGLPHSSMPRAPTGAVPLEMGPLAVASLKVPSRKNDTGDKCRPSTWVERPVAQRRPRCHASHRTASSTLSGRYDDL